MHIWRQLLVDIWIYSRETQVFAVLGSIYFVKGLLGLALLDLLAKAMSMTVAKSGATGGFCKFVETDNF